jgi:hypothetical protein
MKDELDYLSHVDRSILSRVFHMPVNKFPGMLPVSLRSADITRHLPYGYVTSFKADGTRAFLYFLDSLVWTMDRTAQHITLCDKSTSPVIGLTILDVEVLHDLNQIYVFDGIVIDSRSIIYMGYIQRMECIRKWFTHRKGSTVDDVSNIPRVHVECASSTKRTHFSVTNSLGTCVWTIRIKPIYWMKDVFNIWQCRHMLPFAQDGLVFTKVRSRYTPFRCSSHAVFKWKERNTIDVYIYHNDMGYNVPSAVVLGMFQLRPNIDSKNAPQYIISAIDTCSDVILGPIDISDINCDNPEHVKQLIDTHDTSQHYLIFEVLPSTVCWRILGVRIDKHSPNTMETIAKTIKSIEDGITIQDLDI